MKVPTPHNAAIAGQIAPTVIMPGDPLRAKFIAETYLESPHCYNTVRGMLGYTGRYKGREVSVQGSGMGIPSMGIYAYELYHFYGVERIIRVGSAGGLSKDIGLRDIVAAVSASTNSNFAAQYGLSGSIAPTAHYDLLSRAMAVGQEMGIKLHAGNVYTSDVFYDRPEVLKQWADMGALAVEMEAAGLYLTAMAAQKEALALLTISDLPLAGQGLSAEDRQTTFTQMMEIALSLAE
jgi:purine-nucleoside phosphorylase